MRGRLALTSLGVLLLAAPGNGAEGAAVRVRWLGVAGFSIESGDSVLLHDPYLSRPGLLRTLFTRYRPDPEVLEPLLAEGSPAPELARARVVLIGHSHFDHLGDAAWIAQQSGASVAGSATTVNVARGYGLDAARTRRVDPGDAWREGPFAIRVVESRHAAVLLGRVPLEGEVTEPPDGPIHAFSMKLGDARGYLVVHEPSGVRIFLLSSAGLHPAALAALESEPRVDLLLAATQGRDADFVPTLVARLRPRLVVPHHYGNFFLALDDPDAVAPIDPNDLSAFEDEVRAAAGRVGVDVEVRSLALFEAVTIRPTVEGGGPP